MSKEKKPESDKRRSETGPDARGARTTPSASGLSSRKFVWRLLLRAAVAMVTGTLLIVALGIAQRTGWIAAAPTAELEAGPAAEDYTCPMHPQIRQPTRGRCPICGMALVAANSAGDDLDEFSVKIQPAQRRLANIGTATATRDPVVATIQTIGAIAIDESRMSTVAAYIEGRLERLFADYTGVEVAVGDHLAVIYSPELHRAQVEYLATRDSLREMQPDALEVMRASQAKLVGNLRQRLVELGMTETQIGELEASGVAKSRLTIYTPIGGTVIEKLAVEGKYVDAGEPIYRIADLSTVWLMLELYPDDAARIRYGQRVEAEMQSLPGEVFAGRVAFIDPSVDPRKRTVGVRVEFLNPAGTLRPGDYANAKIYLPIGAKGDVYDEGLAGRWISPMHPQIISDQPGACPICGMDLVPTSTYGYSDVPVAQPRSLNVPRGAVLMAGDNSVVYVEVEPGRFEIRPITVGPILRDRVVVLGGLREGERVATAGNFLIDSQMQLAGKPSLIDPARAVAAGRVRKQPLEFSRLAPTGLPGASGTAIESLFAAYFKIQSALAADRPAPVTEVRTLHQLAVQLAEDPQVPPEAQARLAAIARHSERLEQLDMERGRLEAFRPLSHAVVALATQVRGAQADTPFRHMFCPMVKGGGGDWLQAEPKLVNPYWGSQMLHCGEVVREFPPPAAGEPDAGDESRSDAAVKPAQEVAP